MAYINLNQQSKLDRLNSLNNDIGANASIVIYDGTYPITPDYSSNANTLVTFHCSTLAFGNVYVQTTTIGNVTTNTVTLTSIFFAPQYSVANGIAGWARIYNMSNIAIVDLDVGVANSGASIIMNSNNLIANIPVQIISINIIEP